MASTSSLEFERSFELKNPGNDFVACDVLLSGICGSDLGMLSAASSRYFEPLTSFPFVPGHEVVATTTELPSLNGSATRVVLEPALTCHIRGAKTMCEFCIIGETDKCANNISGHLRPGLQTGFCTSTGGGWSERLYAHPDQLHVVPDNLSTADAVMIEPLACAVHSVLGVKLTGEENICVIGSGTVGTLITAVLSEFGSKCNVTALGRYSHQREVVSGFGASVVPDFAALRRAARRNSRSLMIGDRVTGGFDVTFDAVGSSESIEQAIEVTRAGGTIVLAGMPNPSKIDLSALWHKQISLIGSYAYGTESINNKSLRTFDIALELAQKLLLGRMVSVIYPLEDFEEAINHARHAGSRNAIKVAFDPTTKVSRTPREEK